MFYVSLNIRNMNQCKKCGVYYKYKGVYCSTRCEQLKKVLNRKKNYNRRQLLEKIKWKKYWGLRFRGNILPEERSFYNEYNYLLKTEKFNQK